MADWATTPQGQYQREQEQAAAAEQAAQPQQAVSQYTIPESQYQPGQQFQRAGRNPGQTIFDVAQGAQGAMPQAATPGSTMAPNQLATQRPFAVVRNGVGQGRH